MARFHVFIRGAAERFVADAPDPKTARAETLERHGGPIRKVKLSRETGERQPRAPRPTRRELQGEA